MVMPNNNNNNNISGNRDADGCDDSEEEQRIFATAQILCGNLDDTLVSDNDGNNTTTTTRRGDAILELLLVEDESSSTTTLPQDRRPTKRIKTLARTIDQEPPNPASCWSLETTRATIREFQRLKKAHRTMLAEQDPQQEEDGSPSSAPEAATRWWPLMACWLGCPDNNNNNNNGSPFIVSPNHPEPNNPQAATTTTSSTTSSKTCRRPPFWSLFRNALISMAYVDLANHWMEQSLDSQGNLSTTTQPQSFTPPSSNSSREASPRITSQQQQQHIAWALQYWPTNPSALLWAANWDRMRVGAGGGGTNNNTLSSSLELYRAAMKCAHITIYELAQPVLQLPTTTTTTTNISDSDEDDAAASAGLSLDDKFLVETVLFQSTQQQQDDNDDDDDDDDNIDDGDMGESQVLVTAAYMSALLASCMGRHDVAADSLQHFASAPNHSSSSSSPIVITRIHPHVWDTAAGRRCRPHPDDHTLTPPAAAAWIPHVFPDAISLDLWHILREAFRVDGPYWKESGYDRNVYYSFWTDYPLPRPVDSNNNKDNIPNDSCCIVGNAVEHYIVSHLLPRVQSVVNTITTKGGQQQQQVRGFEWWVHTRPHGANIGHQLHFDTDEALLEQDGTVEFPIAATVTYLTLDGVPHGATVLFDQTPYTKTNAQTAYISFPKSRSLLVFPGDLLHGVLPCSCCSTTDSGDCSRTTEYPPQRLTFMVNFWGYRIPDRIHQRSLYGPSGPLPPPTPEHTWVHDICRGYPQIIPIPSDNTIPAPSSSSSSGLVAVSPAWDTIRCTDHPSSNTASIGVGEDEWSVSLESPLKLPASSGIQQRFFVTNAPDYFHSTLLEK